MEKAKIFYEISEAPSPDGRRKVKISLHEIYPDDSHWNLNGITYLEKYVLQNGDSIKGMPLCAAFLDDEKDVPYDHGMTGSDGSMPIFENSVQVGACDSWSIEDLKIDGETHKVCMAYGYVNQQRYPAFVKWLEDKIAENSPVYGSVEFVGKKENKEILYDGGFKKEGRIPMSYDYSGYCFLTVKPSDSSAMLVELNQSMEQEDEKMTIEELGQKLDAFLAQCEELNACKKQLETNAAKVVELNASVEQLTAALEASRKELQAKYDEESALYKEQELLREEIAQVKKATRLGEMNTALADFTDEEKAFAKEDLDKFNADPMSVEINSVVEKIQSCAYRALKDKEKQIAEINSQKEELKLDDIFAPVEPSTAKEEALDFSNMTI
jgi:hypothetical protein